MSNVGLYWHIPFCRALCTYCDFAKTANYDERLTDAYLARVEALTVQWVEAWRHHYGTAPQFASLFMGGGTPSLFSTAYGSIFVQVRPYLTSDCEVTLEANPDDLTAANLSVWRDLGVTRLSVGVQTFDPAGLKLLGRTHDAAGAARGIRLAAEFIPRVSLDLIYGWPGQDVRIWERDLTTALALPIGHLSAYTLTYEPRTPLGRRKERGVVAPVTDDRVADLYDLAVARLGTAGFEQDEVSNWSKPGESSRHNYLYWQDAPYVGVGAGAHGYLTDDHGIGWRYAYDRSERSLVKRDVDVSGSSSNPAALAAALGAIPDVDRDADAWIFEYVGSALRCAAGLDLARVARKVGRAFKPTRLLNDALATGQLRLTADGTRLNLDKSEWFRESAWSVAVALALGVK